MAMNNPVPSWKRWFGVAAGATLLVMLAMVVSRRPPASPPAGLSDERALNPRSNAPEVFDSAPEAPEGPTNPVSTEPPTAEQTSAADTAVVNPEAADLTGDGLVNRRDYILMMRVLAGAYPPDSAIYQQADLNRDGRVDHLDAQILLELID